MGKIYSSTIKFLSFNFSIYDQIKQERVLQIYSMEKFKFVHHIKVILILYSKGCFVILLILALNLVVFQLGVNAQYIGFLAHYS